MIDLNIYDFYVDDLFKIVNNWIVDKGFNATHVSLFCLPPFIEVWKDGKRVALLNSADPDFFDKLETQIRENACNCCPGQAI